MTLELYDDSRSSSISTLHPRLFAPYSQAVRYKCKVLDKMIEAIYHTGYGLTPGFHTRIDSVADYIQSHIGVGNACVNRNMIGAVMGVQPAVPLGGLRAACGRRSKRCPL